MAPAMDLMRGRPALVVAASQALRLVVPLVARLAGNVDPDENAISHVFGQQTICVAMDFPGWWEAACTSFLVAGLMDAFAFAQLYRIVLQLRYGEDDVPKLRRGLLATFCMLMALMSSLIYLMDNPVATPTSNSALWHSVPYVMLQIQRTFFIIFLLACLRSNDAIASVKVAWHAAAVITVAFYVMAVIGIAWTFAESRKTGWSIISGRRTSTTLTSGISSSASTSTSSRSAICLRCCCIPSAFGVDRPRPRGSAGPCPPQSCSEGRAAVRRPRAPPLPASRGAERVSYHSTWR